MRTNRQSTCSGCRSNIEKGTFKLLYDCDVDHRDVHRSNWRNYLWRYYHIERDCLRDMVARRGPWRSPGFTTGDCEIVTDIAPLPRAAGETADARAAGTNVAEMKARLELASAMVASPE